MSIQPTTSTQQSNLHIETTDLLYLLDLVKGEVKTEMNCHAIGTIQTFDPTTMTCTANLNYQKTLRKRNATSASPNTYTDIVIPYPTLIRVPVIVMGGGGTYIQFMPALGDSCLILFNDRDMDAWLESGQTGNPPFTGRLHDLSDGLALVGPWSTQSPQLKQNPPVPTTGIVVAAGMLSLRKALDALCQALESLSQNLVTWTGMTVSAAPQNVVPNAATILNFQTNLQSIQSAQQMLDTLFQDVVRTMNGKTAGSNLGGSGLFGGA